MKKTVFKLLLAVMIFSMTSIGIIANEAKPDASINVSAFRKNTIPDDGSWHDYIDGRAKAYHSDGIVMTRGKGFSNHYFYLFIYNFNGVELVKVNASNGKDAIAQVRLSGGHSHKCSGGLMS